MSDIPQTYRAVTSDTTSSDTTGADTSAKYNTDTPVGTSSTSTDAVTDSGNPSDYNPSDRRASTIEPYSGTTSDLKSDAENSGALGTTQGPFEQTVLQQDSIGGGVPSSVGSQAAPGPLGKIGESAVGALGFGGSHVERPKQDQGLAEKIVNFLGA